MIREQVLRMLPMHLVPAPVKRQLESYADTFGAVAEMNDPRVLASLAPSAVRGAVLKRGKQGVPSHMPASHSAHFDWSYPADHPEMADLYRLAKRSQWDGDDLPWSTSVDPEDPRTALLPDDFFDWEALRTEGHLTEEKDKARIKHAVAAWMLSQFLHGEQGALFAAAQVTEAVPFFDGKLYGSTQVMDEGRHVEVFHRYLDTKLEKLYQVNDNLFAILDALMRDGRWDVKFLGMQIMVEGLALGAFATMYRETKEPLLRALLKSVIQDEARHVHYGVLAVRDHMVSLSDRERREREDWCFEVALLMRNRFLAYEVYEEYFEHVMSRADWRRFTLASPGMERFRHQMFRRLVPNLREIGLLGDRIRPHYDRVGLSRYFGGQSALELDGLGMVAELDGAKVGEARSRGAEATSPA